MKIIISYKFNHIALFHEHLKILESRLGAGILIEGRNIVVDNHNNLLSHATLTGTERIRITCIDALVFKLFLPFFLEFLTVFNLITFESCSVYISSVGNTLKMDNLGFRLINNSVACFSHLKCKI